MPSSSQRAQKEDGALPRLIEMRAGVTPADGFSLAERMTVERHYTSGLKQPLDAGEG